MLFSCFFGSCNICYTSESFILYLRDFLKQCIITTKDIIISDKYSFSNCTTILIAYRLRKVKMDQRKLMDNANTITDMAKVKLNFFLSLIVTNLLILDPKHCI